VPQVSLLRPGIPQTNSHWKHRPSSLSLGAKPTCPACPGSPWGVPGRDLQFRRAILETPNSIVKQNCHLDRRGQGNEKRVPFSNHSPCKATLSFVIPSAAEGSAVPRTHHGNAEFYRQTELSSRPERTRISCHAALDMATCAAFIKESRMKIANATKLHRKSGVA
jgi:hypothetical protein